MEYSRCSIRVLLRIPLFLSVCNLLSGELVSLFIGSVLASTVMPGGVELYIYYLVRSGEYSNQAILWVATVGNTLGGILTWVMGWLIRRGIQHTSIGIKVNRWFRLESDALTRVKRWGPAALLFSWMPIVGDPLCLAAGYLRLSFGWSAIMIAIGKFARYLVLIWAVSP